MIQATMNKICKLIYIDHLIKQKHIIRNLLPYYTKAVTEPTT